MCAVLSGFIGLFFAYVASSPAEAATFSVLCDNLEEVARGSCTIKLTGQITSGDSERLRAVIRQPLPQGRFYHSLLLESRGGSVPAAIDVAKVVRQAMLSTTTVRVPADAMSRDRATRDRSGPITSKCISACFLIWVAGAERYTHVWSDRSDIGLHRPYLDPAGYAGSPDAIASMQQQLMRATSEYLKDESVPQALIEKMLQRSSTQVYWLSPEDPDLTGRAPWFEEMMIATCKLDPSYERESSQWASSQIDDSVQRQLRDGVRKPRAPDLGPRNAAYLAWKQQYNSCEYAARAAAQAALRK